MFVHSVYFWLRPDLTPEQLAAFSRALLGLERVETVRQIRVGTPAATDRPVIDRTYAYALILEFDDQAGHDAYQDHPDHQAFVSQYSTFWTQVRIYDCLA